MKICFVAPADNYHTKKWCRWFAGRGHEVHVVSFHRAVTENAELHFIDCGVGVRENDWKKLRYLLRASELRNILAEMKPDIVNVHYATSYGAAAALAGIKRYVLSVWGADVYDFPKKSPLHRLMLRFSLNKASYLFSTSKAMAVEAGKYTKKAFDITPFGVDTELFSPGKRIRAGDGRFIVGTVKTLSEKYGIDYLIKAAAIIHREYPDIPLELRIAGKGPCEKEYRDLAARLQVNGMITWLGFIPQEQAAEEWANMDAAVIPSTLESESFGVSAVEAQSCGVPVVISDIPGLMEAASPGVTALVVPRKDERALAKALVWLYRNPEAGKRMGEEGRKYVLENYEWNDCFSKIEQRLKMIRGGVQRLIECLSGFFGNAPGQAGAAGRVCKKAVCGAGQPETFNKRILILAENYPDNEGGVSMMYVHTRNLYYREQGLDVTVISFQARTGYVYKGISVLSLREYEACPGEYGALVLHAANIKHHYRFLRKYGARFPGFVFFYHGHEALNVTRAYPRPYPYMKRIALKTLAQEAYDGIKLAIWRNYLPGAAEKSHFVFVSGWMYREFLKWTRLSPNVTAGRYSVIYNCVGKEFEEGCYDAEGEKQYDFITVRSSLDGSKYCIDLVNQLAFHNPSLRFAVIGRGRFFEFNKKAPNLEWKNQTMSHGEMIPLLQKARFALMPTRTDAQGLMMCEMAAFGMPVITSDIPVCHEVFDGVENVYFISNEDGKRDMGDFVRLGSRWVKDRRLGREQTVMREVELLKKL